MRISWKVARYDMRISWKVAYLSFSVHNYCMEADILARVNPHWDNGFSCDYPKKRKLFAEIIENIDKSLIAAISGPRRTGKTVLLKQAIDFLVERGEKREHILYFPFEENIENLSDAIKNWEALFSLNLRKGKYYVFLDEIQYLEDWGSKIKLFYDSYPNIKFFISGSSSLHIRKGKESLAGRIIEFMLPPLSFSEYLDFKGIKAKTFSQYEQYLYSQLPEIITGEFAPHKYMETLVKKVIYEDAPKLYKIESPEFFENIFRFICREPGQIINYEDVSKDFGMNRNTVSKYMEILENSLLVRKVYNFSRNARKTEIKSKKFYPFFPSLCAYIYPTAPDFSLLAETDVAMKLNAQYFHNDEGREIDFLAGEDLEIGIEVKMRKRIDESDIKTLLKNHLGLKKRMLIVLPDSEIRFNAEEKGIEVESILEFQDRVHNGL